MTDSSFPAENGNAEFINKKAMAESRLSMFRLESIFDFCSGEPGSFSVKEKQNSVAKRFACILNVRFWEQEIWDDIGRCCSWSVYSNDREKLGSIILRKVVWDSKRDREFAKRNEKEHQETVLAMLPSIAIHNQYIAYPQSESIIQLVHELDAEIGNGFILHENDSERWEWRDLELRRLYNWGQVHMTWCPDKTNERVEQSIKKFVSGVNPLTEKNYEDIYSMDLNYALTPERYRDWILVK